MSLFNTTYAYFTTTGSLIDAYGNAQPPISPDGLHPGPWRLMSMDNLHQPDPVTGRPQYAFIWELEIHNDPYSKASQTEG